MTQNKEQGDQIQFSPEKKALDKNEVIITPIDGSCYKIVNSSVLQEIFSSVSKRLSCNGKKKQLR